MWPPVLRPLCSALKRCACTSGSPVMVSCRPRAMSSAALNVSCVELNIQYRTYLCCCHIDISPDPRTLLIYIASVPAVFLSLSALLALYLYFFLFNEDKNGLAKQGKQMFYGTVNGSFNSQSSLCTTSSGSSDELPKESAGQLYRDNLQQHFEKESLISKSPKK